MNMTKLEHWLLTKICKRLVTQGPEHESNITEYYRIMQHAAEYEFYEDPVPSLNSFLKECHADAVECNNHTYFPHMTNGKIVGQKCSICGKVNSLKDLNFTQEQINILNETFK